MADVKNAGAQVRSRRSGTGKGRAERENFIVASVEE